MKMLTHNQIREIIPHRYPFLLVDKILELDEGHAVGLKNVTSSEPYLEGHFPNNPIFPGVLLIEAMTQVGGIMLSQKTKFRRQGYLCHVHDFKFLAFVLPGDTVKIEARFDSSLGQIARVNLTARVEDKIVAKGQVSYYFEPL